MLFIKTNKETQSTENKRTACSQRDKSQRNKAFNSEWKTAWWLGFRYIP